MKFYMFSEDELDKLCIPKNKGIKLISCDTLEKIIKEEDLIRKIPENRLMDMLERSISDEVEEFKRIMINYLMTGIIPPAYNNEDECCI